MHAPITPLRVLPDQAQHEGSDGTYSRWPARSFRPGPGSVPTPSEIAVPVEHRVRTDQQPHTAQRLGHQTVQQRRQKRPVGRGESRPCPTQLTLQDRDLVPQRQDLDIFVPVAHRKETQDREPVRHRQVHESQQHSRPSRRGDTAATPASDTISQAVTPWCAAIAATALTSTDVVFSKHGAGTTQIGPVPATHPTTWSSQRVTARCVTVTAM